MKKFNKGFYKTLILIFVLTAGCSSDSSDDIDQTKTIEFKITTDTPGKTADIEYINAEGYDIKLHNEDLPWSVSYKTIVKSGDEIEAVAISGNPGIMTATLWIDGILIHTDEDDGLVHVYKIID